MNSVNVEDWRLLLQSIPPIYRANNYWLYSRNGRRILDLFLADGGAILGHRPRGLSGKIKQRLEQGLYAPVPTLWSRRLFHHVGAIFSVPFENVALYANRERALAAVATALKLPAGMQPAIYDPAIGSPSDETSSDAGTRQDDASREIAPIALARPLLPLPTNPLLLPVLPLPLHPAPQLVVLREAKRYHLPPSDPIAPMLVAAVAHATRQYGDIETELIRLTNRVGNRSDWVRTTHAAALTELPLWKRRGPYLTPSLPPQRYPELFAAFVAHDILIHPRYPGPSLLPPLMPRSDLQRFIHASTELA